MPHPRFTLLDKQTISALIALSLVVLYLYGGLLTNAPLRNHETPNLYYRIHQYVMEFKEAGFPPTLFPDALRGGGFAFPIFYPPLSYYVGAFLAWATKSYYFAGNAALFLSVLCSAFTCYYGFSRFGSRGAAFGAAALYVTIPYRFVDAIARGALAECWTFVWFPLIFCGGVLILRGRNRFGVVMLAFSTAALLLSHAVMALYFVSLCTLLFIITCIFLRDLRALIFSIVAMVFAAGFSAWYIVPQRLHWDIVKASDANFMWAALEGVQKHNVSVSQLFFSDPNRWLGGSNEGLFRDGMSYELGYAHLFTLFAVVMSSIWMSHRLKTEKTLNILRYCSMAAWILSILFVLRCQIFLRLLPESFLYIQFGWRMLGITAFFGVSVFFLVIEAYRMSFRLKSFVVAVAVLGSIASVDSLYRTVQYIEIYPEEPLTVEAVIEHGDKGYVEIREYVPHQFVEHEMQSLKNQKANPIGALEIGPVVSGKKTKTYPVTAHTSATMIVPLVAYPIYQAETDNGRQLDLSSRNGLMTVEGIQPGDSTITITRVLSEPQKLGLLISVASLVLFVSLLFVPMWCRNRSAVQQAVDTKR